MSKWLLLIQEEIHANEFSLIVTIKSYDNELKISAKNKVKLKVTLQLPLKKNY